MITTCVCVVRPPKADHEVLSQGIEILARATRMVFARVYQQGHDAARVKREVCAQMGMLVRHYSGCRADAIGAVKGWREGLNDQRSQLRLRLARLEAQRQKDDEKASTKRRNAIATRKAETRLARVQAKLQGVPRHCFGGRALLRQGKLGNWRQRRAGNALFAGESGKAFGNEVARWNPATGRLELKLPRGLRPLVLENVTFGPKVEEDLRACIEARTPISWRVACGVRTARVRGAARSHRDAAKGGLALDLNADHIAAALVSSSGRPRHVAHGPREAERQLRPTRRLCTRGRKARCACLVCEDCSISERRRRRCVNTANASSESPFAVSSHSQFLTAIDQRRVSAPWRGGGDGGGSWLSHRAWTTKLAREHRYPDRYRTGVHHAAALVIGRRGLGGAEPCAEDCLAPRARRSEAPGYARLG